MLKAIDFFCGAGGMTSGLAKAGVKVLAGIDIDKEYKETYILNNPESLFVCDDIKKLKVKELAKITGIKRNDSSLVFIACSPCQYWSNINTTRNKSSKFKNLLSDFQRFVRYFKPGYIVIENVPGIISKKKESILPNFIHFIESKGYKVNWRIINANHYSVPQNRKRLLLIAGRNSTEPIFPEPDKENKPIVRDVIGNGKFKKIKAGHIDKTDFMHTTAELTETNLKRLKKTPKNGGTRLAWKNDPELQIPAYEGKDKLFYDVYGRMFWNKPAPTITTKFNSISNGRFAHPEQNRGISLREGATLQTFDKDYVFKGSGAGSIARQIGNAVPPELARRIGIVLVTQDLSK